MLSMTLAPVRTSSSATTSYLFAGRDVTAENQGESGTDSSSPP